LKYLYTIKEIREKDPELFEQIKRFPKKARTAKVSQASSLRYFERQASSLRYIPQNHADDIIYFDPEGNTEKRKRNLPHWQQEGNAYFITFRLYDSIPEEISNKIKNERENWLKTNNIANASELMKLSKSKRIEYYRLFSKRYDELLDNGHGSCILRHPECKKIVEETLKHFDGIRYKLDHYVIMPNHVHVIIIPKDKWSLSKITHSWKSYSANELNKILKKKGPVWMHESFDHIIRSPQQLEKIRQYINEHPKPGKRKQFMSSGEMHIFSAGGNSRNSFSHVQKMKQWNLISWPPPHCLRAGPMRKRKTFQRNSMICWIKTKKPLSSPPPM